jgi:putative SOS response-associated peptidase YedK
MCGRYGHTKTNKEKIKKALRLKEIDFDLVPRYNIAPGQDIAVVLNATPKALTLARWGLVPSWAKDEKTGYKMNNARCETIFEKPSFRHCIRKKRCLILADCFYEWQKTDGKKQPYCIQLKTEETFAFAGIWDCWEKGGNALVTCSIVTCEPNTLMSPIHDRMPVILSTPEDSQKWLSECNEEGIRALLRPHDHNLMDAYKISTLVNSPSNNQAEITLPLA